MAANADRMRRGMMPAAIAGAAALAALFGAAGNAAPAPGFSVVYSPALAANAIYDGSAGLPGLVDAFRQVPIVADPRWPFERQMRKLGGVTLSAMSADEIAAAIRAELAAGPEGGLVAIDEITTNNWDEVHAAGLESALAQLGADAERVVFYVGPAMVTQVGRIDLRTALGSRDASMMAALRRAGATFLETYHGNDGPFTAEEFAVAPTRWLARWAPGDPGRLHLLFGFANGAGWTGLFDLARATPAGRAILSNGAGAFALQTAEEGLDWLGAYRQFQANPTASPPQGDYRVPVGGGLTLRPPTNRVVFISIARPARAVLRLVLKGQTTGRVFGVVQGPTAGVAVPIPRNVKPGRYEVLVLMEGEGLSDTLRIPAVVGPPTAPLRLRFARGTLWVSLAGGNQTVIRVVPMRPTAGPTRAIARLKGPLRNRRVQLPAFLVGGSYRAIAASGGLDGPQDARLRFTLARR